MRPLKFPCKETQINVVSACTTSLQPRVIPFCLIRIDKILKACLDCASMGTWDIWSDINCCWASTFSTFSTLFLAFVSEIWELSQHKDGCETFQIHLKKSMNYVVCIIYHLFKPKESLRIREFMVIWHVSILNILPFPIFLPGHPGTFRCSCHVCVLRPKASPSATRGHKLGPFWWNPTVWGD